MNIENIVFLFLGYFIGIILYVVYLLMNEKFQSRAMQPKSAFLKMNGMSKRSLDFFGYGKI